MNFQDRRNYNRRLRDLERNVKFPGMRGVSAESPVAAGYTLSFEHDFTNIISISNGLKLVRETLFDIATAGGNFAGVIPNRQRDSFALTVFGVDNAGNSEPVTAANIDFNELFIKIGAHEIAEVVMTDPAIGNPMPIDPGGNPTFEAYYDRLWLVGFPILTSFLVPYFDGAVWQNPITTVASAPITTYTNNVLSSGNGHCNGAAGVMNNFCCCFSPLLFSGHLAYTPPGPTPATNYIWGEAITREVLSGAQPAELQQPSWWDSDFSTKDGLKHGRVYFDANSYPVYGIAWYIFDIYDWSYNILNNLWTAANIYINRVPECPLMTSNNTNSIGVPYLSNAQVLRVVSQIYSLSGNPATQSLVDAEDVHNDANTMQDFILGAQPIGDALWPLSYVKPAIEEIDGEKYLQREKP